MARLVSVGIVLLLPLAGIGAASAHAAAATPDPLWAPFTSTTPSPARAPKAVIGPASVATVKYQSYDAESNYCSGGNAGFIRWAAVKGVRSYTVVFNDANYGGAEQRIGVAADPATGDWPYDAPPEGAANPQFNAPKGQHQVPRGSGAYFGPGACQADNYDYSAYLTNAHTEYFRQGEFIDGTVTGPCADGECPPTRGVKVIAKGRGGGSDKTDAAGQYSIKVKKGTYKVVPSSNDFKFQPKSKRVSVRANGTGTANFTVAGGRAKLDVSVVPKQSPINVSDSPEQEGPAQTTVNVTVHNTGRGTAEGVVLKNLGIAWDVDGVKAPKPLPLRQVGPPSVGELGEIDAGESVSSQFLVEATGDGKFKLTAKAKGKDFRGPIGGQGRAKIKSQSPLLFIYTRPEQSVPSPDAPALIKAGTALSVRVRLKNRSYQKTLAVLPFAVGLEGNLLGGYLQKAGAPIQNARQIDDVDVVYKANNVVVLEPRESRLLDAVFRTSYSNPSAGAGGGTRGAANFPKPVTKIYDPETGKLKPVDPEQVAFSAGSERQEFSIDDRAPDAPPFSGWTDTAAALGAYSKGAITGLLYSVVGTVRGVFVDLPTAIGTATQAYVQLVTERQAEFWKAVKESKSAHEAFDKAIQKSFEFMLRDFDAVGKTPGALKQALEGFDKQSREHLNELAEKWYAGNWVEAAEAFGQDTGQLAGDIGLADVVLAKSLALLPRINKVVKAANKARAASLSKLKPAVRAFTGKAQSVVRVMRFMARRLKPGYIPDFAALEVLYGLSHKQARFLAILAKTEGILIAVRSRGSGALKWVKEFKAHVKPEWIKIKNVNHYDTEFLRYAEADLDRVVINKNLPSVSEVNEALDAKGVFDPEIRRQVLQRQADRAAELASDEPGYVKWIEQKAASGEEVRTRFNWADNGLDPYAKGKKSSAQFVIAEKPPPGNLMVKIDGGDLRPITGDIDVVALTKADAGTPLTNAAHERILRILAGPPLYIQHPETATWLKDGVFDFAKKHSELAKDLPVQFAPDGLARVVEYLQKPSYFRSTLDYFVHWKGGYRHLDWLRLPGLP